MVDWNDNAQAAVREFAHYIGQSDKCERYMEAFVTKKTVADAVEWANGVWPSSFSKKACAIGINLETGNFVVWDKSSFNKCNSYIVCDYKQFDAYVKEQDGEKWTHRTNAGELCKIHVKEPDVNGVIIVINERGEYLRHNSDSLKPIKPTISEKEYKLLAEYSHYLNCTPAEFDQYISETYDVIN